MPLPAGQGQSARDPLSTTRLKFQPGYRAAVHVQNVCMRYGYRAWIKVSRPTMCLQNPIALGIRLDPSCLNHLSLKSIFDYDNRSRCKRADWGKCGGRVSIPLTSGLVRLRRPFAWRVWCHRAKPNSLPLAHDLNRARSFFPCTALPVSTSGMHRVLSSVLSRNLGRATNVDPVCGLVQCLASCSSRPPSSPSPSPRRPALSLPVRALQCAPSFLRDETGCMRRSHGCIRKGHWSRPSWFCFATSEVTRPT